MKTTLVTEDSLRRLQREKKIYKWSSQLYTTINLMETFANKQTKASRFNQALPTNGTNSS